MSMRQTPRLPVLAALLLAGLSPQATQAQGIIRPQTQPVAPSVPAPALPGLAGRPAAPTIDADPTRSLSPNGALFDAINRGDIAAARDAVARGADLNARNALGLTPVDAAVDQGRHEIVFYLLSAREPARDPVPLAASRAAPLPAAPSRPLAAPRIPLPAAPPVPTTARLWAGDGGAARPEIGFLGFDAGRPASAAPPRAAGRRPG
jgi:hypothetical protein